MPLPRLQKSSSTRSNRTGSSSGLAQGSQKDTLGYASPRSSFSNHSPERHSIDLGLSSPSSIDQMFYDVFSIHSADQSPSRFSLLSQDLDSELRSLAEGEFPKESPPQPSPKETPVLPDVKESPKAITPKVKKLNQSLSSKAVSSAKIPKPATRSKSFHENSRPPAGKKPVERSGSKKNEKGKEDPEYLGPYLLKQTREVLSTGENQKKALELGLRAMKAFEDCKPEKPSLDYVMCLHIVAALYCSVGQYGEAIPVLERSIEVPRMSEGQKHALAKFAGCMQLGDTYAMLGYIENSILCYSAGLGIQRHVLGETDARFGETCRYVAEAHVQAMQFDEAKKLCQMALDIHRENGSPDSLEEAADRRLMGLICDSKGEYEDALEHYVLASIAMSAEGYDTDVAAIDVCIGDVYLSLSRYDEAIFTYQKALKMFMSTKGENHPSVASVFVRLAELYNRIGKFRESKAYCEDAQMIYEKPLPGIPNDEIAHGLIEVAAIYESMNELGHALYLLKKAIKVYGKAPGQLSTIAGIEAQMGVLYYMMGNYWDSYDYFKVAVSKLRVVGEKKSALFGIVLNQMGLACVQIESLEEAADLFEEARAVLEMEYGPHHPDTLGVYSNLAGTYDAMGRWDDSIQILEYLVGMREEKLGTASSDVDDEKRRLAELLKESNRDRAKKDLSLEFLLGG